MNKRIRKKKFKQSNRLFYATKSVLRRMENSPGQSELYRLSREFLAGMVATQEGRA